MSNPLASGSTTSEFKALLLLFLTVVVMPILAKRGITSDQVSDATDASFAFAAAAYAMARTILKLVAVWRGQGTTTVNAAPPPPKVATIPTPAGGIEQPF